jgi:hypothetical protein
MQHTQIPVFPSPFNLGEASQKAHPFWVISIAVKKNAYKIISFGE